MNFNFKKDFFTLFDKALYGIKNKHYKQPTQINIKVLKKQNEKNKFFTYKNIHQQFLVFTHF